MTLPDRSISPVNALSDRFWEGILELNPMHPLVSELRKAHAAHTANSGQGDDAGLAETAELLYGMALLAEGGELTNPSRFVRTLADRLAHAVTQTSNTEPNH